MILIGNPRNVILHECFEKPNKGGEIRDFIKTQQQRRPASHTHTHTPPPARRAKQRIHTRHTHTTKRPPINLNLAASASNPTPVGTWSEQRVDTPLQADTLTYPHQLLRCTILRRSMSTTARSQMDVKTFKILGSMCILTL